jgi:hypothetical protein
VDLFRPSLAVRLSIAKVSLPARLRTHTDGQQQSLVNVRS